MTENHRETRDDARDASYHILTCCFEFSKHFTAPLHQ